MTIRRAGRKASFAHPGRRGEQAPRASTLQALVFNLLLLILPVMAGRVVVNAFAEQGFGDVPTAQAISQTRAEIDRAFSDMVAVAGDPDQVWADAVDDRLRAGDLPSARGFLLAAPQMMSEDRAVSLLEAAREETSGSEDERLARAATIFLPDPVRARYERLVRPVVPQELVRAAEGETGEIAPEAAGETGLAVAGEVVPAVAAPPTLPAPAPRRSSFDLIGDAEDLANRSARWLRGEPTDTMVLRLRGFGQIASEAVAAAEGQDAPFSQEDLALGVSVIASAKRAGRLNPLFVGHLESRLGAALPEARLREVLTLAEGEVATSAVRAARVREAWLSVARPAAVRRLALELELVSRIADRIEPAAAVDLLGAVRDDQDLRRLRLVVEAGGDRTVALSSRIDGDVLDLATSGITWTRDLYLQIMGLAAMGMALLWAMLSALHNSIFRDSAPRPLSPV